MAKGKGRSKLVYGADAHYWREEIKPLMVAGALVNVVAERRQIASQKLAEAVDSWEMPGCQKLLHDDLMFPVVDLMAFLLAAEKGAVYVPRFDAFDELEEKYKDNPDLQRMWKLVGEFIGVAFNRSWTRRVIAETAPWLQVAAVIWTMGTSLDLRPNRDGERQLRLGDRVIDGEAFLRGVTSERLHRRRTRVLKHFGFRLTHDKKIGNMARLWYLCRVRYSGPKECAAKLRIQGENWTAENLSKEIRPGDMVTGYPRRNPRKAVAS